MGDPRDVLAVRASVNDWESVFREEHGWKLCVGFSSKLGSIGTVVVRKCGAGDVQVLATNINLTYGHHQISRFFRDATLGELFDIANELAATRFCGGWKQ